MLPTLKGKVGPHTQGISYTRDNILPPMKQMGGRYAVIVNDWELAGMWLQSGGTPILRVKTPQYWDDDADKNIPDPEAYADHVCNLLDAAELYAPLELKGKGVGHLGNELFTELPERTDPWLAKGIRRYAARKRLCVVGNWAFLNRPRLNKMPLTVRALRETGSWMGYHEGLYGDVWRAEDAIANGAIGGFREEQAQYGFRVLITEFAGSATPHDGWQIMFANRGGYKVWAQQIEKSLQLALETATAVCLYSMPPWNEGRGFDYDNPDPESDEYKLRDELAKTNARYPVKELPMPDYNSHNWGRRIDGAFVEAEDSINVREQPYEKSDRKGTIGQGNIVDFWDTPYQSEQGGKYRWYKILYDGVERYVAEVAGLKFVAPPPTGTVTIPEAKFEALSDYITRAEADLTAARKILEEVVPPLLPPDSF